MNAFHSTRRRLLATGAGAAAGALAGCALAPASSGGMAAPSAPDGTIELPVANGRRKLAAYPGKRPMIVLSSRPPQLETPWPVYDEGLITPNDAFFVRYHNSAIPTAIDGDAHVIRIGGNAAAAPFELTVAQLCTQFEPVELVAVNQCSGNSRALFSPRVQGGQLTNGAMGNARWTGVPLKAILARAGIRAQARQVRFDGLDQAVIQGDFVKSLDLDHALDGEVMVAYRMNGDDLPMLNGYPVRLVVPGYYGTYWMKHLSAIDVIDSVYEGFWMKPAYRIPDNDCACVAPGTTPARTRPIGRFNVRSFITSVADGAQVPAGRELAVRGIAFDGGEGIREVAWSADGGATWRAAQLGDDLGRYSFREFRFGFTPAAGAHTLLVRAWNRKGDSQPMQALWQPAGYMRNVVESVRISAT